MSLQLKNVTVGQAMEAIDKANALVVRDSRAVIKLAEKLLEAADRGEPEVMYELELIEVSHNNTQLLGPSLSPYSAIDRWKDDFDRAVKEKKITPSIDDTGYPEELAAHHYLREIPKDPFTRSRDTWLVVPPEAVEGGELPAGMVFDLHSGSNGSARDGTPYSRW
jgi:hypothetical protein